MIDTIRPAVTGIIGENSNIHYCAVDATNYDSLKKAFSDNAHSIMLGGRPIKKLISCILALVMAVAVCGSAW